MASHGVPRISQTEPQSEEALQKEQVQIEQYKALVEQVNTRIENVEFTAETLQLTSQLLNKNPDYPTAWNHRRRVHLKLTFPQGVDGNLNQKECTHLSNLLFRELHFVIPLMLRMPKSYIIWDYRLWILRKATDLLPLENARQFWTQEFDLVGRLLSRDGRNFHAWEYRRIVVKALESDKLKVAGNDTQSLAKQEFDYTTKVVYGNLSNFSAWHNRSKLAVKMMDDEGAGDERRKEMFESELDLIHNALIDPYDQSLWFYHACLMAALSPSQSTQSIAPNLTIEQRTRYLADEIDFVLEMTEDTKDCKWIYQSLISLTTVYRNQAGQWHDNGKAEEVRSWMDQLKKLDPLRKGRWNEMEKEIALLE